MLSRHFIAATLSLVIGLASGRPRLEQGLQHRSSTNESSIPTNNATAFAIVYGYPLIQYAASLNPVISSIGTNAIFHETTAASADQAAIVRPNVDTVYSKVALDLSSADVAITIPEFPGGRFYVIPFYDLWGNNFENLGTLNNTEPGKYLIRPAKTCSKAGFEPATSDSDYKGFVNFPTTYGLILPRILLFNKSSSELAAVHDVQTQVKIEEVPRCGQPSFPALTTSLLGDQTLESMTSIPPYLLNTTSAPQLLEVLARVASYNLPILAEDVPEMAENLAAAGLVNGTYIPPADVNYSAANQLIAQELLASQQYLEGYGSNWVDWLPEFSGNFHSGYLIRSLIAYTGYLQLVQYEAIYPQWIGEGLSGFTLAANESYILTFPSGKPPVKGFWSITAYNSSSYLIQNPLNVYSLGDRSNITYADGTSIYGDSDRNEPFSILFQPADLPPPSNWTWLPAPAGGGEFTANLRFYGPTAELLVGGSYIYPIVTKQGAITD